MGIYIIVTSDNAYLSGIFRQLSQFLGNLAPCGIEVLPYKSSTCGFLLCIRVKGIYRNSCFGCLVNSGNNGVSHTYSCNGVVSLYHAGINCLCESLSVKIIKFNHVHRYVLIRQEFFCRINTFYYCVPEWVVGNGKRCNLNLFALTVWQRVVVKAFRNIAHRLHITGSLPFVCVSGGLFCGILLRSFLLFLSACSHRTDCQ